MTESQFCGHCYGHHEPDDPDLRMEFRGWRFGPPWLCACCGQEICARQWAFGRACGLCDTGRCQSWHPAFDPKNAHANPVWYRMGSGQEMVDAFAQEVGAERVQEPEALT